MERINRSIIFIGLLAVFLFGCKEEGRIDHIDMNAPAPAQVSNVTVRNTPGGAVLKYKLPADENLLSVKAVYEIQPGVQRETESSFYKDSLVLEGFGETRTYDVRLYSIGMNEKASEPLTVQVNPTTAPVHLATKSLRDAFGGISIVINNPERANLTVVLMGDTSQLGYQTILTNFYTSDEQASFTFRGGLDFIPYDFSVYLIDRWNNLSDTITENLTPLFEEFVPKNDLVIARLPNDGPVLGAYAHGRFFDGLITTVPYATDVNGLAIIDVSPFPVWITWDMRTIVTVSRFTYYHYLRYPWEFYNATDFELWGSMDPNPDGSWDESWIPLGHFITPVPNPITDQDVADILDGIDCELEINEFAPDPYVPVRYLRFKVNKVCSGAAAASTYLQEISIWGQIQ